MAERTNIYKNVTRIQLQNIQRALLNAGVTVYQATPPTVHSRQFDAGTFNSNGYDINYTFTPNDPTASVGTLTVKVSGSLLFIGTAVDKLKSYIQPYLSNV